jgi:transposase
MARFLVPLRSKIVRWRGALEGLLPEGHLARFIWRTLTAIDFSDLEATYRSIEAGPGRSPFHPRVLAALWTYGMTRGMEEATAIAEACLLRDDFRWLAGGLCPSDQTLLNLLTRAQGRLPSIWEQLLRAMHDAGHVDLSAVAEDGTKLRANASRSSFHTADEIAVIIKQLRGDFEKRIARANARPEGQADTKADAAIVQLRHRLARAERAAAELRERENRRSKGSLDGTPPSPSTAPAALPNSAPQSAVPAALSGSARFHRADFRHDAERDVMVCPSQESLHLIGVYPTENGKGRYRLYGRSDCRSCAVKTRCTNAQGRRLKVSSEIEQPTTVIGPAAVTPPISDATAPTNSTPNSNRAEAPARPPAGPQASITEPEALMMLATSEKRWEPSYNADITVTRHGVIVNQFLTKRPTDYYSFEPALAAVSSTLKPPQSWVGDGHYGTHANLIAAAKAGVVLYAGSARAAARSEAPPPTVIASVSPTDDAKTAVTAFRRADFRLDVDRDLLVCPAGEELHFLGEYPTENRLRRYRIYARSNCGGCLLKARCTEAKGRRVKIIAGELASGQEAAGLAESDPTETSGPTLDVLIREHEARMNDIGPNVMRFRGQTVEPVNSQLKQHGLGRLHVHGLARCGVVLALACMAHNLMKWNAREVARAMKKAA